MFGLNTVTLTNWRSTRHDNSWLAWPRPEPGRMQWQYLWTAAGPKFHNTKYTRNKTGIWQIWRHFPQKFFEITTITSNLSRQSEIFAHFLCFQASLHVHLGRSTVCKKISFNLPSSIMIHMMVLPLLQELLQNVQTFISCLHFFLLNLSGDKIAYTYSTL